jgi:murein DD-endopeptidase MepM/ murein hydrolase activator NlpD
MRTLTLQALFAVALAVSAVAQAESTCPLRPAYYPVSGAHQHGWHPDLEDRTGSKTKFLCGAAARQKAISSNFHAGHEATDIFAELDTQLVAVTDGTIAIRKDDGKDFGGNSFTLTDSCGTKYYYAHLNRFNHELKSGDQVTAGTVIGYLGKTGNAAKTAPHLHLSITTAAGRNLNPYDILGAVEAKACEQ